MATDYKKRINIPHNGSTDFKLFGKSGEHIATGYERIVFGGRGPYIELDEPNLVRSSIYLPDDLKWKLSGDNKYKVDYFEFRTHSDYVKIYFQRRTVDYADYLVDKFYISPFDLYDENGNVIIEKLRKK